MRDAVIIGGDGVTTDVRTFGQLGAVAVGVITEGLRLEAGDLSEAVEVVVAVGERAERVRSGLQISGGVIAQALVLAVETVLAHLAVKVIAATGRCSVAPCPPFGGAEGVVDDAVEQRLTIDIDRADPSLTIAIGNTHT